jgi:hypothetical protein
MMADTLEDWGRRIDAVDGARRAGWAKYYEAEAEVGRLTAILERLVEIDAARLWDKEFSIRMLRDPGRFEWFWGRWKELGVNPDWVADLIQHNEWFREEGIADLLLNARP